LLGITGITICLVCATQLLLWRELLQFVDQNSTPGGFGTPLQYLQQPRDAIIRNGTQSVIGRLDGQAVEFDGDATVWAALLYDVPSVRFEDDFTRVYPVETTIVLLDDCNAVNADDRYLLRDDDGCYGITTRSIDDLNMSEYISVDAGQFANGVNLTHYVWDGMCLDLVWTISQPTIENYQFAVHFFNANDERIAQADGLSWLGTYWSAGDTIVRTFCVPEPDSTIVEVGIGMYTFDGANFFGVERFDDDANAVDPMIRFVLE